MRTDLFLATKFLREGRGQTVLVIIGAAIGVTVVFFLTALVAAVERTMIAQTLDVVPHVVVRRPDLAPRPVLDEPGVGFVRHEVAAPQALRSIENWPAVARVVSATDGVTGISPVLTGPALVTRGGASRGVTLLGIDAPRFEDVIVLDGRLRAGRLAVDGAQAVIGVELAADLGVDVGDSIRVSVGDGPAHAVVVAGLFDLGNRDVNERWLLVSLRRAQSLLRLPGGVSQLEIRCADPWDAPRVAAILKAATGLEAESWIDMNAQLDVAISSQRGATVMIRLFVALAVAIGIASVLAVSVVQRSRQIGILRAMGATRATVVRVFLWQGGVIAAGGTILGCALGTFLSRMAEQGARNPDGSPTYPIELPVSLYATVGVLAVVAGLIASALPARRAARMDPATAVRGE